MAIQSTISQHDVEKIITGITIPSPPQIIADIQVEMAMPDPDLNEMARIISKDVGVAGGVIKTVNSPFYGQNNISSISKAVMMLGMNTIMNIVNTLYLRDSMTQRDDISDDLIKYMTRFWDAATDTAQSCMIVAQRVRYPKIDMTHMLGLFHNAGIPLLILKYPEYPAIMTESYLCQDDRIVDTENKYFKTNHAVLSYYVARSWKLPQCLCDVIAKHHNYNEIFPGNKAMNDEDLLLSILKLAEHISKTYQIVGNQPVDNEWECIGEKVIDHLSLSLFDYDDLVSYAADMGIGNQINLM